MEENNKNTERNSTVAISSIDAKKLDRFCKSNGLSKKEFISASLNYFIKEGINPKTHESPNAELSKLNKRIDQLFGFIKKQEQDILKPILHEIVREYKEQNEYFQIIMNNQKKIHDLIRSESKYIDQQVGNSQREITERNEKNRVEILNSQNELKRALQILAQYMDDNNKKGLIGKLFN